MWVLHHFLCKHLKTKTWMESYKATKPCRNCYLQLSCDDRRHVWNDPGVLHRPCSSTVNSLACYAWNIECCNCATQLSIWILLRNDVMKGDRCFWMCVCVGACSTVNQTHHCTIHLCSLFGHGRRPCVHTLAQLHYWQKSALLNTTGQIHRWTNESIRLMKSCEEEQLHSCCNIYTPSMSDGCTAASVILIW